MSVEFAAELVHARLLQTARLLEWMRDNAGADAEAVSCALGAVLDAHTTVQSLRVGVASPA